MARQAVRTLKKGRERVKKRRGEIFLIAFGLMLVVSAKYAITAGLLISVALLAYTINYLEIWIAGIELATLTTVLVGATFGPWIGAVTGLITIVMHLIFGQYMGIYDLWLMPSYAVAGFAAGMLTMPIAQRGVAILLGLHTVFFVLLSALTPEELSSYLFYAVANIVFNLALFYTVAPTLFALMGTTSLI